jgi:hypothetical protein
MDWAKVLAEWGPVLSWVLTVLLGVLAWWLNSNKNVQTMREKLAQIIGDVLVFAIEQAQGQMALVTDEALRTEADIIYDKLSDLLPPNLHDLVIKLYTKEDFEALVIQAWRNAQKRGQVAEGERMAFWVA